MELVLVVLYDHFAGDNSSLKFIIKFRKKIHFLKLHLMQLFSADTTKLKNSFAQK
jgi:hypothetical protein